MYAGDMDRSRAAKTLLVSSDNLSGSQDMPPTSEVLTLFQSCDTGRQNPSSHLETASKSTVNRPRKRNAHACQQCGKIFDSASHLRDHMISHSDEAAYQCEFCDKKYKYSCSLTQHRRQHTGNLPFKCSHCDKAYPNPSSLEAHLKKNCPNALRNCHTCKESFVDIESLKQHLTTHIPPKKPRKRFKCDYCNKLFKFPAHVREHVLMHTGEKPHECHICGMRFPRKKSLKVHFKTHSGEIPPPSGRERSPSAVNQSDNPQLQSTTIQPTSSQDGITHTDQSEATQAHSLSECNKNECSSTEVQDTCTVITDLRLDDISTEVVLQNQYHTDVREEIAIADNISNHLLSALSNPPTGEASVHSQTPPAVSGEGLTLVNLQGDSVPFSGLQVQDLEHITTNLLGQINAEIASTASEPAKKGKVQTKSRYCCEVCGRKCKNKSHLRDHMISHSAESQYKCDVCDKRFKYKSSLGQHLRRHSGDVPFKCDQCDAAFVNQSELGRHKDTHNPSSAKNCDRCDMIFQDRKSLRNHQRTVHKNEPRQSSVVKKKYVCSYCNKSVGCLSHLQTHILTHTGEKPHECETCGRKFSVKTTLTRHIRTHTGEKPFKCDKCSRQFAVKCTFQRHTLVCGKARKSDRRFTPRTRKKTTPETFLRQVSLNKHSLTNVNEKRFICNICDLSFAFETTLTKHLTLHPKPSYECKMCAMKCKSQGHLRFHCRHAHMSGMQYKCKICRKMFPRMAQLLGHEILHGQGTCKQYQCDVCFQRSSTPRSLVMHRRKHVIENKLKCNVCQKDFKSARSLILHSSEHVSNVSFICSCGQRFLNHQSLVMHARTHLPISLGQMDISPAEKQIPSTSDLVEESSSTVKCGRYKSRQSYLNRHRRNIRSLAKKSYCVCGICRKYFPNKSTLSAHYLTHLNTRSHSCRFCRQSFNSLKVLQVHLRTHADRSGSLDTV